MKNKVMPETVGKVWAFLKKNVFVTVVLLVGLVLILLPTGGGTPEKNAEPPSGPPDAEFSLAAMERRIASALSQIQGAGKVTVVLTLKCGVEQVLAKDTEESSEKRGGGDATEHSAERRLTTVVVSGGGGEAPVTLKYIYPEYLGALVVAEGADDAAVKLQLVRAVAGLTGLGADKIVVSKMNKI
jgi:stage III sporulation protein AG